MILNIKQIEFGHEPEFIIEDTLSLSEVARCKSKNAVSTEILFFDGKMYTISLEPVLKEKEGQKNELRYMIYENDSLAGYICMADVSQKKILFVNIGYDYYEIQFHGSEYKLYEVGLEMDKHYLCLYKEGKTVAIVHKPMEVTSHLDTYEVYLEDEQYRDIACIAALFIDASEYSSDDEIADSRIKEEYLSFNKELNAKFDEAFIERVKKGIGDKEENSTVGR